MARDNETAEAEDKPVHLTDMGKDPEADETADESAADTGDMGPTYHYRHRISLDHDDLDKLDMAPPKAGDKVHVVAHGEVASTSAEDHKDEHGRVHKRHRVEIQLKKLHVAHRKEGGALKAIEKGVQEAGE